MRRQATHEAQRSAHEDVKMGSERGFGLVFAVVFAIVGLWPLKAGLEPRAWALGVAAACLSAGLLLPALLRPLNILWFRFGMLLGRIMTPIVMAVLFYGVVLPIGFIMGLRGHDPLRLRMDRSATSYWIDRTPPGPEPESLRNQY
jgi:hypothetical protein